MKGPDVKDEDDAVEREKKTPWSKVILFEIAVALLLLIFFAFKNGTNW